MRSQPSLPSLALPPAEAFSRRPAGRPPRVAARTPAAAAPLVHRALASADLVSAAPDPAFTAPAPDPASAAPAPASAAPAPASAAPAPEPAAPGPALIAPGPALAAPDARRPPGLAACEQYVRRAGRHCHQVLAPATRALFSAEDLELRPLDTLPLYLTPESPGIPFADRPDSERSPLHWGQMKLFAAELWALTLFAPEVVIYAGAAPGQHTPFLASLYPGCRFLLYDPAPFCEELAARPPANVEVHNDFFDEATAARLGAEHAGANTLFACDIRTGMAEGYVGADMARQEEWVRLLDPAASLLKFRLPWQPGETTYLDGDVLLGVFPPLTSTECRLVTTRGRGSRAYDNTAYERQCAYHNTVGRVFAYEHAVRAEGLDHCHDCAALVRVVEAHLRAAGRPAAPEAVGAFIAEAQAAFGAGRTLATAYASSTSRQKGNFPRRDYAGDQLRVEARAPRAKGRGPVKGRGSAKEPSDHGK